MAQVGAHPSGLSLVWAHILFFSLLVKLLLPPLQFILVIVYRGLPVFCLPYYFSFYYIFVLAAILALFFVNLSAVAAMWVAPLAAGLFFITLGLVQAATQPASLPSFLALSTALNLGLILVMCTAA